jgi:glycosyltransferase involved in cell wall biosynthesis
MKLSIIVTTFNIDKYIEKCLASICEQTLKDIEIIVVDDASTDNTKNIIESYAKHDSRIKTIFFEKNTIGGVASAANAGLEIATGTYIGFADGDDWYEPDMFEKLYNLADTQNAEVAFCNYLEFDESSEKNKVPSDAKKWLEIKDETGRKCNSQELKAKLLRFNPVPWRKIYLREFIERNHIRFPVGDYFFEDNPFHWQAIVLSDGIVFDDFIGCYHRVNRPGQTMSNSNSRLLAIYQHHTTIRDFLVSTNNLERYQEQSLGWLVGNTCWIAQRMDDQLLMKLMHTFKAEIDLYDTDFVHSMLDTPALGRLGSDLVRAALDNAYQRFEAIARGVSRSPKVSDLIKTGKPKHSLVKQAYDTYRVEGIRSVMLKTAKFLRYKYNIRKTNPSLVKNGELLAMLKKQSRELSVIRKELKVLKLTLMLMAEERKNERK